MTNSPQNVGHRSSSTPLVSVVIPSYNKGATLREAVESIVSQDYPNIEILIVNDGSTDNTAGVAETLRVELTSRPIFVHNKPNGGVSDARNHGLERTRGFYVTAMDGDDIAAPSLVSTAVRTMQKHGANMFYCNVEIFGAHPGEWCPRAYDERLIRYDNCLPILSLYERQLWEKSGGYKVALGFAEDWEYWVSLSRHGLLPVKSEEKLFRYRSHDDGIAGVYIHDGYNECFSVVVVNNEDLYPVEEVLRAHSLMLTIRDVSVDRAVQLDAQHPNQWFLKFWFALRAEAMRDIDRAFALYKEAINASSVRNWQVLFRLGVLLLLTGKADDANNLLHLVQTVRPDTTRFIRGFLKQFESGSAPQIPEEGKLLYSPPIGSD